MSPRWHWFTIAFSFVRWALMALFVLALAGCGDRGDPANLSERAREIARVRAHLERVERELRASAPLGLNAAQAEKRAAIIEDLHRYILDEKYPTNRVSQRMTPIFVDGDGARCAVASLLEQSGHRDLVGRIARASNLAYVEELKGDAELQAWLVENGLTLLEAARIQPSYANTTATSWQPTVSVFGSVQGGGAPDIGAHIALAPGVRIGARRVTESDGACDQCVYTSTAFVVEYTRTFVLGAGSTNQIGLLAQLDLSSQAYDYTYYIGGGPLASIDENSEPGFGLGGQVSAGFSFRRRSYPLFAEVIGAVLGQSSGATVRGGLNLGAIW